MKMFTRNWWSGMPSHLITYLQVCCVLLVFTMASTSSFAQCADGETAYTIDVTGGFFPSEVSWELQDGSGVIITSGLAPVTGLEVCLAPGCDYTLIMDDSFGDGWNGANWTLREGTEVIAGPFTFTSGSSATEVFGTPECGCTDPLAANFDPEATLDDGSCVEPCEGGDTPYNIDVFGGSFASEVSWFIYDENDVELATGSAPVTDQELCLPDGCYRVEMFDSFGDGWNGFQLTLSIGDDVAVGPFTVAFDDNNGDSNIEYFSFGDVVCDIPGCIDPEAINFDPEATVDNGTCIYPPTNDLCSEALPVTCGETINGTTIGATADVVQTCGTTDGTGGGVWYTFTPSFASAQVTASLCGSNYDSKIRVYRGSCDGLICITGEDDDFTNCSNANPSVNWVASNTETYYILVHGFGSAEGIFELIVDCVELECGLPSIDLSAVDADGNEITGCLPIGSSYFIQGTLTGGFGNDNYTIQIGANTPFQVAAGGTFTTVNSFNVGTTYNVSIAGVEFPVCAIVQPINVPVCPPANDECENAVALTVNPTLTCTTVTPGSTVGATASPQPDDVTGTPNNDVWFSFVATNEVHQISLLNVVAVIGFSTDMGFGVYDATNGCEALTLVDDSDPNSLELPGLVPGNTYYVRVYGWSSGTFTQQTTFDVCVATPPPPPANDNVCDATPLPCGETLSGTTVSATTSAVSAPCTGGSDEDVFYTFVASPGTEYTVSVDGAADYDAVLSVYSGACDGTLTNIGCADNTFTNGIEEVVFTVESEQTIYVQTYDWSTNAGTFTISLACETCVAPVMSYTSELTNCENGGTLNITATVDVPATSQDGIVLSTLLIISASVDGTVLPGGQQVPNIAGQSVSFSIDISGYDIGQEVVVNTLVLGLSCPATASFSEICPPANDTPCDAIALTCDDQVFGTNVGANTAAPGEFCDFSSGSGIVYYSFTNTDVNPVIFGWETCNEGTDFDSDSHLFSGTCDDLTCLTYIDGDFGCSFQSWATGGEATINPGQTVYLGIDGFGSQSGLFELTTTCEVIDCQNPTLTLDVVNANGDPLGDCGEIGDQFYVQVNLSEAEGNATFNVTANGANQIPVAAGGSAIFGPFNIGVNVNINAVGVDNNLCSASGSILYNVCPPENDICADASPVVCGDVITGTTLGATVDNPAFCGTSSGSAGGVWFVHTPTFTSSLITASLCNSNYDSKIRVYSGSCEELVCVVGEDDDFANCGGLNPQVEWVASSSETYYILVHGFGSSQGTFELDFSCVEITCSNPELTLVNVDADGNPITACQDVSEDFFVDATISGGDGNDTYNAVVNGAAPVVVDANSTTTFGPFNAGATVNVSIVGIDNDLCDASASITSPVCPPDNDSCADAQVITCGETVAGTLIGAVASPSVCDFGTTSIGVWYEFTAPVDGAYEIETCLAGTDFDTDSHVFTGTCDNLVCFPGYEGSGYVDGNSACSFQSWATGGTLTATAGTTYYIKIDGFAGLIGSFELSITCPDLGASLIGTVDGWNNNCAERDMTVSLYTPGTATLVESYTTVLNPDGSFEVADIATGTYDVFVKIEGYLSEGYGAVVITGGENPFVVDETRRGDLNGDEVVNFFDGSAFNLYFAPAPYNSFADFNCDGVVNFFDASSLNATFNQLGDEPPFSE